MKKTIALLFALSFIVTGALAQNGEWELKKNQSGIKVYTRTVEGEDIREFKATTTIKTPRRDIAFIIMNVNDYVNWYPDIKSARVVKKISTTEFLVYNVLDLPFPATDRDGVSSMKVSKTKNTTKIAFEAVNDVEGDVAGLIRITKSHGHWKLTTDGENTKVHFQYFASPAGSLPDWIINMFIVDNPYKTLKILKGKFEE